MNDILQTNIISKRIRLDIYLCKQCDLKCRYCYRFCNIANTENYEYEDYVNDLTILKKSNIDFRSLILNGGEPLLHPDLLKILQATRSIFKKTAIYLHTNGKQFLKKANPLIPVMKENNIYLNISEYRKTDIDYDTIRNLCKKENIQYNDVWNVQQYPDIKFDTEKIGLNKKSEQDTLYNYRNKCRCTCICLWKGKIYRCGKPAWIETLNKKYNTDFKVNKDDYLDINDITSVKQLLDFSKLPGSFCQYCFNNKSGENDYCEWSNDKPSKSDWVEE